MIQPDFTIDRRRERTLYRQIAEQIKTRISDGRLPAGSRLPTVRGLAQDLGVTRLTVQSAYAELQADGWLEAVVGRGTFVSRDVRPHRLSAGVGDSLTTDGVLGDMLALNKVLGMRSMAIAEPDGDLFPVDEFWANLTRLRHNAAELFGYTPVQGDGELLLEISRAVGEIGIEVDTRDIIVTSGVMQGLSLVTRALARPGDFVVVEQPTFIGYLNILKAHGVTPLPVQLDDEGPRLEELSRLFAGRRPAFFYTIPNFHNPTGRCWSAARRRAILALCRRQGVLIVEDDIYGRVAFDRPPPPPFRTLTTADNVIYLSGYSKAFMPGLRVGYIILPPALVPRLLTLRRTNDLCGSGLEQRALAHFLRDGGLKRHLRRVLPIYRQRRDALMVALERYMPADVSWSRPAGGYSSWLTLPRTFEKGELYRRALRQGFAFTAGEAYEMADAAENDHLRLCFGNQTPEGIRAGVELLAGLINSRPGSAGW